MDDSSGLETWDTKWSDFAIVADSDEVLRCHKVLLAKCSPFFDAMLSSKLEETKNSKMEANEFGLETVKTFLEYVYAKAFGEDFDEGKIAPELIRLCHVYQVKGLFDLTMNHLKKTICDSNAVAIWFEAENIKNDDLKDCAIKYIGNKGMNISLVTDIDEAYNSPELMKSLVHSLLGKLDLEEKTKIERERAERERAQDEWVGTDEWWEAHGGSR